MNKNKLLFFTDMHFGIHGNSPKYLEVCQNTMDWLRQLCAEEDVGGVLFGGDFFDSRTSIDVKTMNAATRSLYDLADTGVTINMILGNHDLYLKDSHSIHSLLAYDGNSRINVVSSPVTCCNGQVIILPWGYDGSTVDSKSVKWVFCHNDFPKEFFFNYGRGKTRSARKRSDTDASSTFKDEFGLDDGLMRNVVANGAVVLSGHVHQSQNISLGKASIEIVGSPYETEYGFGDSKCGAVVVDFSDGTHRFFENPQNCRHVEIRTSSVDSDLKKMAVEGNFVRLKVDTQESFETISSIQRRILAKNPFHVFPTVFDFAACPFGGKRDETANPLSSLDGGAHGTVSSKLDYVLAAIDREDFGEFTYDDGSARGVPSKETLKELATAIYGKVRH